MDHPFSCFEGVDFAVTVTDAMGTIVAMNPVAATTFAADGGAALVGKSVLDCHPEPARSVLAELLATGRANHYTITKSGRRKIIHQMPYHVDGVFAGLIELSLPIPDELPHFERG